MTICDIYDALTAADRPYKKAVTPDRAIDILELKTQSGQIDAALCRLFVDEKVYEATQKDRSAQ
jgi:HD-GYP domain-containing protein (c-di-GMP phosphodiesterase class II)